MRSRAAGHKPTPDDWHDLALVSMMLDWIVEDARIKPRSVALRELLQGGPKARSRLSEWPAQGDGRQQLSTVLKALPGIDDIGANAEERKANLLDRLPELSAFEWLSKQQEYKSALATTLRHSRGDDSVWIELRFLRALSGPLHDLMVMRAEGVAASFPTGEEFGQASIKARHVVNFLRQNGGLFMGKEALPWEILRRAEEVSSALRALERRYRKPRADSPVNEHLFVDAIADRLAEEFGRCSATVLSHLAELVGYAPEVRKMQRIAATVNKPGAKTVQKAS